MKTSFRKALMTITAALVVCMGGNAQGGILTLAETPLFLTASIDPNVFFLLDDSGSMDWEILVDGEASGGRGYESGTGYAYLYSGGPRLYSSNSYSRVEDEAEDGGKSYWRFKSPDYNVMYYDPAVTYLPWAGTDASGAPLYASASPTAAPWDPENPSAGTEDLTRTIPYRVAKYYRWSDHDSDDWPDASGEHTQVDITSANAPFIDEGRAARTDCATNNACTYSEEIQNFANWFTYYRKRSYVAWAAIGRVIADSTAIRTGIHRLNDGLYALSGGQSVFDLGNSTDKFNILDSLYCQTGSYCAQAKGTPARSAMKALGNHFAGSSSPILPVNGGGKCQQNFNITVTDGYWNGTSPSVGNEDGNGDTTFDGGVYADSDSDTLADVAMRFYEDDLKTTYPDEVPTIIGVDEAAHQHLVTYGVAFGVVGTLDPFDTKTPGVASDTDPADSGFSWPSLVKGNTPQTIDDLWHAAFNGRGQFLSASNPQELITSLSATLKSIADRTSSSSSVALSSGFLNSYSLLFQARFDSSDWSGQLLAYSIVSSGASVGSLGATPEWDAGCVLTGHSSSNPCPTTGAVYPGQDWQTGREIITFKPSSALGIPFAWPASPSAPSATELDPAQVTALKTEPLSFVTSPTSPTVESDAIGQERLEFLRGRAFSTLRSRSSLLGDIINSNPVFVEAPSFAYPDSLETAPYSTFVSTNASRDPVMYVGANDGMLHAFDASKSGTGGTELLAYVPSPVYKNLSALTSNLYGAGIGHRAFVDASATAGDVFWGSSWKTVLVGALGKGGQGIFALDITDPTSFDESNASTLALWEFTDADDADLGFTYGQPAIVRMHNGKWAAIIGNGYNNTDNQGGTDTHVSPTGNGVIYVIDIEDGSLIKKFDTGVGTADDPTGLARPNGVATVAPVDSDGDHIVDAVYAGDLFGNVWKIDVSDISDTNWDFAFKTSGTTPQPFFVAKNASGTRLPITTRVEVGLHPSHGGQMIYFGTGKYLEINDSSPTGQDTQTFFSVWDRNESIASLSVIERTHLQSQSIIEELAFSGSGNDDVRRTSANAFVWHSAVGLPTTTDPGKLGWFMDLYSTEGGNTNNYGERMVADPVLRDGKIIFVTLLPLADPCDFGGDSWLMELNAANGSRLTSTAFDLNNDDKFDLSDLVSDGAGGTEAVGGIKSGVGIMPRPGILKDNAYNSVGKGREFKYFSGSSGAIQKVDESRSSVFLGRQSWREIYGN